MPKKDTSIEKAVEGMLKELGITYVKQAAIEAIAVVDFYIPGKKAIVQCDGTYWHSLKHKIQNDTNQDFLFGFGGYRVLRLKEKEINENPKKCLKKLSEYTKWPQSSAPGKRI